MILTLCFILLFLALIWPFIGGQHEMWKKVDSAPLLINMSYLKDPRYFAVSFRKIFLDALKPQGIVKGESNLYLSKLEIVESVSSTIVPDNIVLRNVYYVTENLVSKNNVVFEKEVYVQGSASIGEANQLRALACDGDIHLHKGTTLSRWLDAAGNIRIEEQCSLGISVTCTQKLSIAQNCSFHRLYGFPIIIGETFALSMSEYERSGVDPIVFEGKTAERNLEDIPSYSRKDCTIITPSPLVIGEHSVIRGHVKTHKKLVVGAHVTITGNVFAEGDIHLEPYSRILGTVFSQGCIILEKGVIIGSKGRTKSVVGKNKIILHSGVTVHGYVATEGEGVVV